VTLALPTPGGIMSNFSLSTFLTTVGQVLQCSSTQTTDGLVEAQEQAGSEPWLCRVFAPADHHSQDVFKHI